MTSKCLFVMLIVISWLFQRIRGWIPASKQFATCTPTELRSSSSSDVKITSIAQQSDSSTESITSFLLPRYYNGEIEEGNYPSPLHYIHVTNILSDDEVTKCLQLAKEYAESTGSWSQPDNERHELYSTCDFPVHECEALSDYLDDIQFDDKIWNQLMSLYGVPYESISYLDFFCASYQPVTTDNPNVMDRLDFHRDGSLLSFTITLNSPTEFVGGGTIFDGLRDVSTSNDDNSILRTNGVIRPHRAGNSVFHSGKVLHGADVVTEGTRIVLVGFMAVADYYQRPGALTAACRDWGRADVAKLRYEYQTTKLLQRNQQKSGHNNNNNGWFIKSNRWLPPQYSRCNDSARRFRPAFSSAERRADPEFQRIVRLEAEDRLLRSILLPTTDLSADGDGDMFGGDITLE